MAALVQTFGLNVSPALRSCSQLAAKFKSDKIEKQLHTVVRQYGKGLTVQAGREVFKATRDAAPDDTGDMRSAIALTPMVPNGDEYQVTLESPLPYSSYSDTGTPPHRIPKAGGPVAFFWPGAPAINRNTKKPMTPSKSGKFVFAYVNHPGTKAQNWWGSKDADNQVMRRRWQTALTSGRIGQL